MKKILVTTDLSSNSKSAMRFAIQLASQSGYSLTFFHAYHILRPTRWSEASFVSFEKSESTQITRKLHKLVSQVYQSLGLAGEEPHCVAKSGAYADREIIKYANEHNYDFICISRSGHGKTTRLFGSNTSSLIKKSKVPVIAIPDHYKRARISAVTYLSDLANLDNELKKVSGFAQSLDAKVEMLHFKVPVDYLTNASQLSSIQDKLAKYGVNAHYEPLNYEKTLIENIMKVIKRSRPSMLIMFTDQKRTLFEKIFMSSISAEFSSMTKIPLLIFNKD